MNENHVVAVDFVGTSAGFEGGSGFGSGGSEMGLDDLAQLNPVARNL